MSLCNVHGCYSEAVAEFEGSDFCEEHLKFFTTNGDVAKFLDGKSLKDIVSNPVEPSHYTSMTLSPLEYITANEDEFTWCIANVIKYVSRYKRKNGIEDLEKAAWYLNHQIKLLRSVE